eukprot:TRINITY_DN5266_c0_g2_i1.p1 TRINITY_DN5266_c0_g2~~TRINITY_DN5266_c0_g2_i1.p1  ORF type:complete len:506 (+),score=214.29 TRINITY_DN5266_c0_g2_i1:89-1606(+)
MAWRGKPIATPTPSYKGSARIARGSERSEREAKRELEVDLVANLKQQIDLLQQERVQLRSHITSPQWHPAKSPATLPLSPPRTPGRGGDAAARAGERHAWASPLGAARDDIPRADPVYVPPSRADDLPRRGEDFVALQRDHSALAREYSALKEDVGRDKRDWERRVELAEADARKLRGQLEETVRNGGARPGALLPPGGQQQQQQLSSGVVDLRRETPWEFLRGWSIEDGRKFLGDMERKAKDMKWSEWTSADLTKFVTDMDARVASATETIKELEGTLGATKNSLTTAEAKVLALEAELEEEKATAAATKDADVKKAELARQEAFADLEKQVEALEAAKEDLEKKGPENAARVEYYKAEIETKDLAIIALQKQVTELETKAAALKEDLQEARHEAGQEAAEVKRLTDVLDKRIGTPNDMLVMKEELEQKSEEIARLKHRETAAERRHVAVQRHTELLLKEVAGWEVPLEATKVRDEAAAPAPAASAAAPAASTAKRPLLSGLIL